MGTIISFSSSPLKTVFKIDNFEIVSSSTSNTATGSILIPANSLTPGTGNIAELTARAIKTGVVGITTLRVYANTTDSISGATLLATGGVAVGTDLFQQLSRTMFVGKSPVDTAVINPTTAIYSDDSRFPSTESNVAIDWTVDQYIILAVQNVSTLDSTVGSGIVFKIYK